ncbi:transglutaminase-like protein [Bacteriovorax sp. BAL6_X]|uniref:transglutaminase domain-containing protein n=1 Tax=Bacteriovorax sp. BAL6_X TaxID=1201290 RepID=UPI000385B064|nr:transglutaminase domain-containing protein [Bacteriovorax sp. BAL6_X]EPZ51127.1 transglutaminase-like protein [Bacteriovorax sp. BAL6_X]
MRHIFILFYFCLFSISNTSANEAALKRVQNSCIESIDWSNKKCSLAFDQQYNLDSVESAFSTFFNFVEGPLIDAIAYADILVEEAMTWEDSPRRIEREKGKKLKSKVLKSIKSADKGLSSCQKACLVKCVTSNYLEYSANFSKFINTDDIFNNAKGVCTEFSDLAEYLGDELGIEVRVATAITKKHAYNQIKIDDRWFSFEPQSERCEFYIEKDDHAMIETNTNKHALNDDFRGFDTSKIVHYRKAKNFSKSVKNQ